MQDIPGRVTVVVPTYNEADNIAGIIARVLAAVPAADVLVVDDGSPDGTGAIADALAGEDSRVRVLHRPGKGGLGAAYRAGFAEALSRDAELVVEMDADGSHHPEQLPRLIRAARSSDVVVGSRWVPGGRVEGWPLHRRLLSQGGSAYARGALGLPQRDVTGGFRVFRASALRRIDPESVLSQGYCFQIELLWRAHAAGLTVVELPITFTERERGASKMSGRIVLEAMGRVTLWALRGLPHPVSAPTEEAAGV